MSDLTLVENASQTQTSPKPTHRPNGQFAPGNKLSKGNAVSLRQAEYRRQFQEAVSPLDMQAFARRMLELSLDGDMAAARIVCDYTLGKPKPMPDEPEEAAEPFVVVLPIEATA